MEINDFLGIAIVGAGLSLLMEWIQAKYQTQSGASKLIVLVLSIVIGAFYWFMRDTVMWQSMLGVLAAASTVYALIFSGNKK